MQQPLIQPPPKRISPSTSSSSGDSAASISESGMSSTVGQFLFTGSTYRQGLDLVQSHLLKFFNNEDVMSRTSAHLTVILLAVLAVVLSSVQWPWGGMRVIQPLKQAPPLARPAATSVAQQEEKIPFTLPNALNASPGDVFPRAAVPHTIIPERARQEITQYKVESGDTIYGIAYKFGLSPETVMWSNPNLEDNPDLLQVGQELTILPFDGVYHQVGGGDTLEGIAATFKTEVALIVNYPDNHLDSDNPIIQPGQWLVVPGGTKPFVPRTVTAYTGPIPEGATLGTGNFVWPASGVIYQGFWSGHPAIDIAAWNGAPVLAADSGYVIAAGWDNTGYGYHVVIDHGNGYQTLYAHLQAYYVDAGQNVSRGQQIGEMGSTGHSTGPHLHFEVRQGTVQRNPVGFLP